MMGRYVLSPRAQSDLEEIWNYTERRWGTDQAEAYTRQLWQHIKALVACVSQSERIARSG